VPTPPRQRHASDATTTRRRCANDATAPHQLSDGAAPAIRQRRAGNATTRWRLDVATYSFGRSVNVRFEDAIQRVTEALQAEGFGVLTDIDVQATFKKKLDVDVPPYRILGACNPPFAHRAISAEPEIGALLPCNVVVRAAGGEVRVEMMDPEAVLGLVAHPDVRSMASEVRARLERALAAV
jgi:uncharacterized protein (DUF302 family)